jgi:hypothetical protein
MILDKVFHGVLDHSAGCLIVFEEQGPDVLLTFDCANLGRRHMMQLWRLLSI